MKSFYFRYPWISKNTFLKILNVSKVEDFEIWQKKPHPTDKAYQILQMKTFLTVLSQTEFPVLLLWSHPKLALRFFESTDMKNIRVRSSLEKDPHALSQAYNVCMSFICGSIGRLSPRDAWVGSGFGKFTKNGSSSFAITRNIEKITAEPNLKWLSQNWSDLNFTEIQPGVTVWQYLHEEIEAQTNKKIKTHYLSSLKNLKSLVKLVEEDPWNFFSVKKFIQESEKVLSESILENLRPTNPVQYNEKSSKRSPHCWWISRFIATELELNESLYDLFFKNFDEFVHQMEVSGVIGIESNIRKAERAPFLNRLKALEPERIVYEAEEFYDSLVKLPIENQGCRPYFPKAVPKGSALVFMTTDQHCKHLYLEPNPKRLSDRIACNLFKTPLFSSHPADADYIGIKPQCNPDNRLLRTNHPEKDMAEINLGDAALYFSTLFNSKMQKILITEFSSPRYEHAPDILPIHVSITKELNDPYGRAFQKERIWLLNQEQAIALSKISGGHRALASQYFLVIHSILGSPTWLTFFKEGKRLELPAYYELSWKYFLHVLRTAKTDILVKNSEGGTPQDPYCFDQNGSPLSTQIFIRND